MSFIVRLDTHYTTSECECLRKLPSSSDYRKTSRKLDPKRFYELDHQHSINFNGEYRTYYTLKGFTNIYFPSKYFITVFFANEDDSILFVDANLKSALENKKFRFESPLRYYEIQQMKSTKAGKISGINQYSLSYLGNGIAFYYDSINYTDGICLFIRCRDIHSKVEFIEAFNTYKCTQCLTQILTDEVLDDERRRSDPKEYDYKIGYVNAIPTVAKKCEIYAIETSEYYSEDTTVEYHWCIPDQVIQLSSKIFFVVAGKKHYIVEKK